MQVRRLALPMAAMLCTSAAMAHASVSATDVGFSCSQTHSIDDTDGLLVGCTGDMRVFGSGADSVLSSPGSLTLRATASLRLDDVRLVSPRIVLDALQVFVSSDVRLDASGTARPSTGTTGGQGVLSAGGDVRLGGGLDPNRLQVLNVGQEGRAGDVSLRVAFQAGGHISGSHFASGSLLSASSGQISVGHVADITGGVVGAFFGPGRDGGTVLITSPSVSPLRYAQPFVLSAPRVTSLVPEPGSWALAGCAGLVLMAVRRRQST